MLSWTYILCFKKKLTTWVSKNTLEIFHSEYSQSQFIDPCTRIFICNYCGQKYVSVDILYDGKNVHQQEYLGFSSSLFKQSPSIIYDITKIKHQGERTYHC